MGAPDVGEQAGESRPAGRRSGGSRPARKRARSTGGERVRLRIDRHADYLLVKEDEPSLLDYLATLVAKEYVVFNNPRAGAEEVGEELVRMLVRVRRHLPRRR